MFRDLSGRLAAGMEINMAGERTDTAVVERSAELVLFRRSMAMAVSRIGVPPPVVFVRGYEGETEEHALARSGHRTGDTQFVHLA